MLNTYQSDYFKVWDHQKKRWIKDKEITSGVVLKFKFKDGVCWVEVTDRKRYEIVPPYNGNFYEPEVIE